MNNDTDNCQRLMKDLTEAISGYDCKKVWRSIQEAPGVSNEMLREALLEVPYVLVRFWIILKLVERGVDDAYQLLSRALRDEAFREYSLDIFDSLCELRDPPEVKDIVVMLVAAHYEGKHLALKKLKKVTVCERDTAEYCLRVLEEHQRELWDRKKFAESAVNTIEWLLDNEETDIESDEEASGTDHAQYDEALPDPPLSAAETTTLVRRILRTYDEDMLHTLLEKVEKYHVIEEAAPALIRVLRRTDHHFVRCRIATMLRIFRNTDTHAALLDVLHDERVYKFRGSPIYALEVYEYPLDFPVIMDAALADHYEERWLAGCLVYHLKPGSVPVATLMEGKRRAQHFVDRMADNITCIKSARKHIEKISQH